MSEASPSCDHAAELVDYWMQVEDGLPFAQGDILRSVPSASAVDPTFGLIITADCDIVQSKAADRLTYVEVVSTVPIWNGSGS
jgi:hypothetical protein